MKKYFFLIFLPICLKATDLAPWYDPTLELHWKNSYVLQSFDAVNTPHTPRGYRSNASFFTTSLAGNYELYAGEIEAVTAASRHRTYGWDNFRMTLRYQLFNDDIGDAFSLTAGAMLSKAYKQAVHDISSFHHGRFETELHAAIGKQCFSERFWTSRIWSVLVLGMADQGSPWLRANFQWEKNCWDWHQVSVFAHTLWGFGKKGLRIHDFKGYGPVRHQSIDLGLRYSYFLECSGATLSAQYSYRVYALNFPRSTNRFFVSLHYPIGLR